MTAEEIARRLVRQTDFWRPREQWPKGPWDDEGDEDRYWEHAGFNCIVLRSANSTWNGYVVLPEGHPWGYLEAEEINADVHGGITFSGTHAEFDNAWLVGFDCGHSGDHLPAYEYTGERATYRNVRYAMAETCKLARHAANAYAKQQLSLSAIRDI